MKILHINNLNQNALYILSVQNIKTMSLFARLIKFVCDKIIGSNVNNISVQHTALMIYIENNWYVCEVGYSGLEHRIFEFFDNKCYFVTNIGKVSLFEKEFIFNKFKKQHLQNKILIKVYSILSILIGYPYPFLTAVASVELHNGFKAISNVINYSLNFIRDVQCFILESIFCIKKIPYCTQAVLDTINQINIIRESQKHRIIYLSDKFYNLFTQQGYKNYEIYPQQIIETMKYSKLIKI